MYVMNQCFICQRLIVMPLFGIRIDSIFRNNQILCVAPSVPDLNLVLWVISTLFWNIHVLIHIHVLDV